MLFHKGIAIGAVLSTKLRKKGGEFYGLYIDNYIPGVIDSTAPYNAKHQTSHPEG